MFFESAQHALWARTLLRALGYWQNTVIGASEFMISKYRGRKLHVASFPIEIQNVSFPRIALRTHTVLRALRYWQNRMIGVKQLLI